MIIWKKYGKEKQIKQNERDLFNADSIKPNETLRLKNFPFFFLDNLNDGNFASFFDASFLRKGILYGYIFYQKLINYYLLF